MLVTTRLGMNTLPTPTLSDEFVLYVMMSLFISQSHYCPLVWMNGKRTLNYSTNNLHNKALPLAHNGFQTRKLEITL